MTHPVVSPLLSDSLFFAGEAALPSLSEPIAVAPDSQGDCQMGLAGAAWPQRDYVLAALDKGQPSQVVDAGLGHSGRSIKTDAL